MKKWIKNTVGALISTSVEKVFRREVAQELVGQKQIQTLLAMQYRQAANSPNRPETLADVEFSVHSQNGENGILLYIFSVIGFDSRKAVEVCAGNGMECNAANLALYHGFDALLVDGDEKNVRRGREFFKSNRHVTRYRRLPPKMIQAWVTVENINSLIAENGFSGEIDLFSLDMDGVDYHIWERLDQVQPRVVVLEYNNRWPADRSVTVPYREDFLGDEVSVDGVGYFGASLQAFVKLGKKKGYRLVGANSPNTNAFFLRNDIQHDALPEVSVESCLNSDYAKRQQHEFLPKIEGREVIEI